MLDINLDLLPDEVILHIFTFLSCEDSLILCQVCSRWRRIAEAKTLWWNKGVATIYGDNEKDKLAFGLMKAVPVLGILNIRRKYGHVTNYTQNLDKLFQHSDGKVRKLCIDGKAIIEDDWQKILQFFGDYLEELEIHGGHTSTLLIKRMSTTCSKLQEAYLFDEGVFYESLLELWRAYPVLGLLKDQLKKLSLCVHSESLPLIYASQDFLDYFCAVKKLYFYVKGSNSHLKWILGADVTLDVKFCSFCGGYKCFGVDLNLDTKAVDSVQNLIFRFPYRSSSFMIRWFLKRFPQLKKLNYTVEECYLLREQMRELPQNKIKREGVPDFSVCFIREKQIQI